MEISTFTHPYAERVSQVPKSFIREILKVTSRADVVSFAGGLPNPELFPVKALQASAENVFNKYGNKALQYTVTEGLPLLREFIAERYRRRFNLNISPDQILITNGSQQALDLIAKLFIDKGDDIVMERPAYLGALQCFGMYQAKMHEVTLFQDGIDTDELELLVNKVRPKLLYGVPNFQNPSGISYSIEKRRKLAAILSHTGTTFVEDDPYGEICFDDTDLPPVFSLAPDRTILLGSFSKIISPGMRLGWMVADKEIINNATILKQASDLHSSNFTQYILAQYLDENDLGRHIRTIRLAYAAQCQQMLESLYHYFPFSVTYTRPKGGMFCWLRLPEGITARQLLEESIKQDIIFVPGDCFYVSDPDEQTLRLNFSNLDKTTMDLALKKLGSLINV